MVHARRFFRATLIGATLGALILGLGGRLVMRLLTLAEMRETVFSVGGTLDVMAYGGIVGAVSGLVAGFLPPGGRTWARGSVFGLTVYVATILTLPAHIAETARPFADRMPLVLGLFGLCFLIFGIALVVAARRR